MATVKSYLLMSASAIEDAVDAFVRNLAMKLGCASVPAMAFAENPYRKPPIMEVQQTYSISRCQHRKDD